MALLTEMSQDAMVPKEVCLQQLLELSEINVTCGLMP